MRKIMLLGAPGSGKGTQAQILQEEYKIPQISTGDIIRAAIKTQTELGQKFQTYSNKGKLVPDKLVVALVEERMKEPDVAQGWILDGFPRTIKQAKALDTMLKRRKEMLEGVILIQVPEEILFERLTGRRTCSVCKQTFHTKFKPAPEKGCTDGGPHTLEHRKDDSPEVVPVRLEAFQNETAPLIDYYKAQGKLHIVDGNLSMDQVREQFKQLMGD